MVAFIPLPNPRELHHQDTEILIISKEKDTSRVSSKPSSTIQEEVAHLSRSISEILINTSTTPNISSLLKEPTPDNTYSLAERQLFQLVTFSQSTESQKVPPSATSNPPLETRVLTPDVQEPTPPLSDTQMMAAEPESDSHQEPERPFQAFAEPLSVSLPVEEETKSPS